MAPVANVRAAIDSSHLGNPNCVAVMPTATSGTPANTRMPARASQRSTQSAKGQPDGQWQHEAGVVKVDRREQDDYRLELKRPQRQSIEDCPAAANEEEQLGRGDADLRQQYPRRWR